MDLSSFLAGFASFPVLVCVIVFIVLTVEVAYDWGWHAFVTLAVYLAAIDYVGWFSLHHLVTDDWERLALGAAAYVPIGVAWCVVKWWFYVHDVARKAKAEREAYVDYTAMTTLRGHPEEYSRYKRPQVSERKADITRWMAWWPFSFVATMLNDPFRRLFNAIYRYLGASLQSMADKAFEGIDTDVTSKDRHRPSPDHLG